MSRSIRVFKITEHIPQSDTIVIVDPMRFLTETGLLWRLNHMILNPFELSLTFNRNPVTGQYSIPILMDFSRSREILGFADDDYLIGERRFKMFMDGDAQTRGRVRMEKTALKDLVQPRPVPELQPKKKK